MPCARFVTYVFGPYNRHSGGEIGIRTLDRLPPILDFESSAFDHSAISPRVANYTGSRRRSRCCRRRRSTDENGGARPRFALPAHVGGRLACYFFGGAAP